MKALLSLLLLLAFCSSGFAASWYVSPSGQDAHDGRSPQTAWRTVQKGADALGPGDELVLLPGVYTQQVTIQSRGTADAPVRIRAMEPGFSTLTGWKRIDGFRPVKGHRFVWELEVSEVVHGVCELDSRSNLLKAPALEDMDLFRGSFFYDETAGKLYIHSSDGRSPNEHALRATVLAGYGLQIKGNYAVVEGLTITGFSPASRKEAGHGFGVLLEGANHTVRDCTLKYNAGGIKIRSAYTVVEHNVLEGNVDPGHNEMAQIYASGKQAHDIIVRGNRVLNGETHGIRFYGRSVNVSALDNIVVNNSIGLYFKASVGDRVAQGNVVVNSSNFNYGTGTEGGTLTEDGNTFGSPSVWGTPIQPAAGPKTLVISEDPRFCAPELFDFRLQADSPALGKGAHPNAAPVLFVSHEGSDTNDGGSERSALKTLSAAFAKAQAGTTIYLSAGTHLAVEEWTAKGAEGQPIILRGRGEGATILEADLRLHGARHLRIENMILAGHLNIEQSRDVALERCLLQGKLAALGSENLQLRHSMVEGGVLLDEGCRAVRISSSVLEGRTAPPLVTRAKGVLTEYNLYHPAEQQPLARIGGESVASLDHLRSLTGGDHCSIAGAPLRDGWVLRPDSPCLGAGEAAGNIGVGIVKANPAEAKVEALALREVTPTTASFTWWTPNTSTFKAMTPQHWTGALPVLVELHYGVDSDCPTRAPSLGDLYHRLSIFDLEPDTTYFYKIVIYERPALHTIDSLYYRRRKEEGRILFETEAEQFQTPKIADWHPLRRTLYASPEGIPGANGETAQSPLSLARAAEEARAGDTVLLLPGVYRATFAPVATGAEGMPITLKAAQLNTAVFDGSDFTRPSAVALWKKEFIVIDGIVSRNFADLMLGSRAGMRDSHIYLSESRKVEIRNCVLAGVGNYTKGVTARGGGDLLLHNNAFIEFPTAVTGKIDGTLRLEQNTWYHTLIRCFRLEAQEVEACGNLYYGQSLPKVGLTPMVSPDLPQKSDGNAFYFTDQQPPAYIGYGLPAPVNGVNPLEDVRSRLGLEKTSVGVPALALKGPLPPASDWKDGRKLNAFRRLLIEGERVPHLEWFTTDDTAISSEMGAHPRRALPKPL